MDTNTKTEGKGFFFFRGYVDLKWSESVGRICDEPQEKN
jgi:hypothetical protein